MSNAGREKPLPKPPKTPFGRQRPDENAQDQGPLLADRLAAAMSEGKLEEFLKNEMPDNEYARNLASMMMGMTGMAGMPAAPDTKQPQPTEISLPDQTSSAVDIPGDVRSAIQSGDVQGLIAMLRREHQKRSPGAEPLPAEAPASPSSSTPPPDSPLIDKDIIDALIRIASDNSVTLDWIILRAIKVYVQEYQKTGRL